ncbi:winged helix DNA-binding protein [Erythrobacter sp.]|uniref:winged helix DNA-binding protein n=1 Tax=Erythrobacter sp. TaxID=1042 RepID=UPI003C74D2B2
MTQLQYDAGDLTYDSVQDAAGLPARVAIFADRGHVRQQIAQDLGGAGFRTVDGGNIAALLDGPIALLGDAVLIDCPVVEAETLAALTRLDMRVAQAGAQLIVSTSMDSLDDVFAALDQSDPQILVDPGRADRIVAVGRILACMGSGRVREMSEEDRMSLLHLSRQVEQIANRIEGLTGSDTEAGGRDKAGASVHAVPIATGGPRPHEALGVRLPDPHFVREVIAARQARRQFFDAELFSDPAWDMLLDLTAAHVEGQPVSVTSLCIAANVPATTALRWLKQMVESGLFVRGADPTDKRRAFIALSDASLEAMSRYFAQIEAPMLKAA